MQKVMPQVRQKGTHVSWLTVQEHPNDSCIYPLPKGDTLSTQKRYLNENENVNLSDSSTMSTM